MKNMSKFPTKNALLRYFWAGIRKRYFNIWNHHLRICQIVKFREKIEMPKFATKNALFGYFWTRCLKSYCHTWNKHPWVCLIDKFRQKTKCLSCGLKMPYLGILWVEFEKLIVTFGISTLGFVWLENFTKKQKRLNLGPKMTKFVTKNALFGCFGAAIWKQYCHILNQYSRICLTANFRAIMKIPKFCLLSYLKSAP